VACSGRTSSARSSLGSTGAARTAARTDCGPGRPRRVARGSDPSRLRCLLVEREFAHEAVVVLTSSQPQRQRHADQHDPSGAAPHRDGRDAVIPPSGPAAPPGRSQAARPRGRTTRPWWADALHAVRGRESSDHRQASAGGRRRVGRPASGRVGVVVPDLDVHAVGFHLDRHLERRVRVQHCVRRDLADGELRVVNPGVVTARSTPPRARTGGRPGRSPPRARRYGRRPVVAWRGTGTCSPTVGSDMPWGRP